MMKLYFLFLVLIPFLSGCTEKSILTSFEQEQCEIQPVIQQNQKIEDSIRLNLSEIKEHIKSKTHEFLVERAKIVYGSAFGVANDLISCINECIDKYENTVFKYVSAQRDLLNGQDTGTIMRIIIPHVHQKLLLKQEKMVDYLINQKLAIDVLKIWLGDAADDFLKDFSAFINSESRVEKAIVVIEKKTDINKQSSLNYADNFLISTHLTESFNQKGKIFNYLNKAVDCEFANMLEKANNNHRDEYHNIMVRNYRILGHTLWLEYNVKYEQLMKFLGIPENIRDFYSLCNLLNRFYLYKKILAYHDNKYKIERCSLLESIAPEDQGLVCTG